MSRKIKVLVVDDQSIIRSILSRGLNKSDQIEVVGVAADAFEARDKIVELKPDVVTLDVEMPKMNGLEFLKKLMPQFPLPVIMVSSLTLEGQAITLEALDAGAVDFIAKPDGSEGGMKKTIEDLIEKIVIASKVDVKSWKKKTSKSFSHISRQKEFNGKKNTIGLIAIGASTGGTIALKEILTNLPGDMPPIVIVQHMPQGFTKLFAERLNSISSLDVKEAENGDELKTGGVLVAPGDIHLVVREKGKSLYAELVQSEKVSGHRPSVDILFRSISELSVCKYSIGLILTGMGRDGANGLKGMSAKNAITIGQDEQSCVVYGMPREAYLTGAVMKQVSLESIPDVLVSLAKQPLILSHP